MCGIVGMWRTDGRAADAGAVQRATERIAHRGPDDFGYAAVDGAGTSHRSHDACSLPAAPLLLGHRRLSILDLSPAGWQPMSTADGQHLIVFNGEIYNYIELGKELACEGVRLRSHSDSEVLLEALVHWGAAALPRLVGMFAFAYVDVAARRVLLARDPFGIKPLYIAIRDSTVAFASEIKALLELPHVRRVVSADRLYAYLRSSLTDVGAHTMFEDVHQLGPGEWVTLPIDGPTPLEPRRFWRVRTDACSPLSFEHAAEELRALFLDSIRLHLRSDVPVGAALSGGIDSSAIVAAMRHVEPSLELQTFSFASDDPAINEEKWARAAGGAAGATMHTTRPSASELAADLDALIATQDEPFGSSSIYAQYRVFQLARERGIKVMLDGQGADEMLAGYPYFMAGRLATLLRRGRLFEARRFLSHATSLPHVERRTLIVNTGDSLFPRRLRPMAKSLLQRRRELAPDWLNETWFVERGVRSEGLPRLESRSVLREQLAYSIEHGLPSLLRYEDRNSMAHSLESRVPFLTPRIAEFLFSLPDEYIISREGISKSVFRAAMRGIVPDPVLDRRDKIGFQTPELSWLSAMRPWVERVLASDAARSIPALNHDRLAGEWRRIVGGEQPFDRRVWRWLNVIRWVELNDVAD